MQQSQLLSLFPTVDSYHSLLQVCGLKESEFSNETPGIKSCWPQKLSLTLLYKYDHQKATAMSTLFGQFYSFNDFITFFQSSLSLNLITQVMFNKWLWSQQLSKEQHTNRDQQKTKKKLGFMNVSLNAVLTDRESYNMIHNINKYILNMDEAEIQEQKPSNIHTAHKHAELISIRKKLAAPNNILPGSIIRSQQPIHLLPFNPDFQSQPGYKMLLDNIKSDQSFELVQKNKKFRSKNVLPKTSRAKYMSEIPSPPKLNQSSKITDFGTTSCIEMVQKDSLSFLERSLKNVFQFREQIVFVSKTAIINNPKIYNSKSKKSDQSDGAKKAVMLRYLKLNKYFASTSFAYNESKDLDQFNDVPDFPMNEDELLFEDNFESSNIYLAMRCDQATMIRDRREQQKHSRMYLIALRFDYNTQSYGQWFYFKVTRKQQPFSFSRQTNNLFKFMIVNMTKSSSMFGKGLKISVCRNGVWRKQGINIHYYKNSLRREDITENSTMDNMLPNNMQKPDTYYTLEFTLEIYDGEQIYISYNEPYTYSRMGKVLDRITSVYEDNKRNIIDFKRNVICQTYLNNNIEALTFSAKNTLKQSQEEKKVVFVVSRSHPVETAGSHVLQGVLNNLFHLFIQSPLQEKKDNIVFKLLQKYILKIIPMVNPDGVILGNSRCNIAGYDLNRSWRIAHPDRCKQIYSIKKYVMQYQNRIEMFIDLHAHSKKKNVFAYGCHDMSDPFSTREFPFLLSKLSENDFLFSQCQFTRMAVGQKNEKAGKDGTARVFLYDVLRIPNVFTIQNSYCSARNSPYHYDKSSYEIIGGDILQAISLYFSPNFKQNDDWKLERHKTDIELKVERRQDPNHTKKSSRDQLSSSMLKFSLTSSINQGLELKLSVNSQYQGKKNINPINLRQRYLCQLRQNENNISIGLIKDGEASESEEQHRIYEFSKTKKLKPEKELKMKDKKHSKTAQKLINFMHKTRTLQQAQKARDKYKGKFTTRSPSLLKASSAHSDTNLVNVTHVSKKRFYTLSKNEEPILMPSFDDEEQIQQRAVPLKVPQKSKKTMITEFDPFSNTKKLISVVDIGLGEYPYLLHDFRANLVDRVEGKFNLKLPYQPQQTIIYRDGQVKDSALNLNKTKDNEIKEYLRKLIRPKQILERKQRLAGRQQKTERTEINLKQSNIQFSDVKLTKMPSTRARLNHKGAS